MDFLSSFFGRSTVPQLDVDQLNEMLDKTPHPFLLDVRTAEEYKEAHIAGAELIPLDELSKKLGRVPKNREVVCVCASGSRSSVAARQLEAGGYKVYNLRGGMGSWMRKGLAIKKGMAKG